MPPGKVAGINVIARYGGVSRPAALTAHAVTPELRTRVKPTI